MFPAVPPVPALPLVPALPPAPALPAAPPGSDLLLPHASAAEASTTNVQIRIVADGAVMGHESIRIRWR